jgi:hypothetical protein
LKKAAKMCFFATDKVLVDTEMYNNGDVGDDTSGLGNGVHLHIFNRREFPYKYVINITFYPLVNK